jgi:hypothetical protein
MVKAIAPDGSCHPGLGKENSLNSLNTPIILITLNNYCPVNMRNKK